MSFGIEVRNGKQNVIIDDTYINYYLTTTSPNIAMPGSNFPPPGVDVENDLIFAATAIGEPAGVGVLRPSDGSQPTWWGGITGPSYYRYYVAKKYNTTSSNEDYGLEIFNSSGNNVFLPPADNSFDIIASGGWRRTGKIGDNWNFPGPYKSYNTDPADTVYENFQDVFVLVNNNYTFINSNYNVKGYNWEWEDGLGNPSNTKGRIYLNRRRLNDAIITHSYALIVRIK